MAAWQIGGVLNVTALLLFLVSSAAAAIGALQARSSGDQVRQLRQIGRS